MKRYIEYLLVIALLLPTFHDLRTAEDSVCVVADGGQYLDEPSKEVAYQAPPKTVNNQTITLQATVLRRFVILRIKCLRLFSRKPIIHSESPRHGEMRSGDVSSMRI